MVPVVYGTGPPVAGMVPPVSPLVRLPARGCDVFKPLCTKTFLLACVLGEARSVRQLADGHIKNMCTYSKTSAQKIVT